MRICDKCGIDKANNYVNLGISKNFDLCDECFKKVEIYLKTKEKDRHHHLYTLSHPFDVSPTVGKSD